MSHTDGLKRCPDAFRRVAQAPQQARPRRLPEGKLLMSLSPVGNRTPPGCAGRRRPREPHSAVCNDRARGACGGRRWPGRIAAGRAAGSASPVEEETVVTDNRTDRRAAAARRLPLAALLACGVLTWSAAARGQTPPGGPPTSLPGPAVAPAQAPSPPP